MRKRLDELLVERELFANLHDAQAAIMAGEVVVDDHRADHAGARVHDDVRIRLKDAKARGGFVSRGGLKLQKALDAFSFDVTGLDCVDLGASSGGFTDCLLQRGAAHVSAVDVNSGQFDWSLRGDARVSLFEKTNIRNVSAEQIEGPFDLAVADLSFISLRVVMADVASFLKCDGSFVSLVKPQFEVAKGEVEKGGVVRDASLHERSITQVLFSAQECGLIPRGLTFSPITGKSGNIEFLFWAQKSVLSESATASIGSDDIHRIVSMAHAQLGGNT